MARAQAVKKQESNGGMPAWMNKEGSRGSENVGAEDMTIPRIDVIQDLSPQRKRNDPQYIAGAEEGMLWNTATSTLLPEEVPIIPVFYRKEYLVWKDRDSGGGFRGAFQSMSDAADHLDELEDGDSCEVQETGQQFCLFEQDGRWTPGVISLSKGKMGANRKLNTLCQMHEGDRFSHMYTVKALQAAGQKGDYFTFDFKYVGWVEEEALYKRAEELYESIRAGTKDVKRD